MKHRAQVFNDIITGNIPHNPVMLLPFPLHFIPAVYRAYITCQGCVAAEKVANLGFESRFRWQLIHDDWNHCAILLCFIPTHYLSILSFIRQTFIRCLLQGQDTQSWTMQNRSLVLWDLPSSGGNRHKPIRTQSNFQLYYVVKETGCGDKSQLEKEESTFDRWLKAAP